MREQPNSGSAGDDWTQAKVTDSINYSSLQCRPHWTSNPQEDPHSTINAMMESVFEGKPTWRVRDHKRCVVVAQGFYEWLAKGKDKVPHFVKRADGKLMVFGEFRRALARFSDVADFVSSLQLDFGIIASA